MSRWIAFGSGTMALAAALRCAAYLQPVKTQVVLPAYSCPDIVAAALFSGLAIHFADLGPQVSGITPHTLNTALATGARIAVLTDLFGTDSRLPPDIHLHQPGVVFIHDRAQSLAGPGLDVPLDADFVVVSRGRGKPATLLGGGAAWAKDHELFAGFTAAEFPIVEWNQLSALLRGVLYNVATQPLLYGAVSRLPFLHLGETRLQPLPTVTRLSHDWLIHAARQLRHYHATLDARRNRTMAIADVITGSGFRIPADAMATAAETGLNRLPVLCHDATQAQWLVARGKDLGISPMYGKTLPEFLGMTAADAAAAYPNAYTFSRTVVTLPTHARVDGTTRNKLRKLFRDAA